MVGKCYVTFTLLLRWEEREGWINVQQKNEEGKDWGKQEKSGFWKAKLVMEKLRFCFWSNRRSEFKKQFSSFMESLYMDI